ncbi:MAG TPA: hypothetical protein VGR30_15995 [Candidatus Binatia bacterium]|jgi:hypothetical protein|nr:hypothetical protein [Candidatus Binatia bacterium]
MNWRNQVAYSLAFALIIVASGCESIALMPRSDVDRDGSARSDVERGRYDRGDARDRNIPRDEIVGTIQRVDERDRKIELRTSDGRLTTVRYDSGTRVYNRDRELQVESLRRGDIILVQLDRDARGDQYAYVIRMNDRQEGIIR